MSFSKWLRNQTTAIALALTNVEKSALGQEGKTLASTDINHEIKVQQSDLLQALKKGEMNQEVRDFRWRIYKTIQAAKGVSSSIVGYKKNEDGDIVPIVETRNVDNKRALKKIKADPTDTYPIELVVNCGNLSTNFHETLEGVDTDQDINSTTFYANNKGVSPIDVVRDHAPQFEIETYSKKIIIRTISDTKKLVEFYVSKYPDVDFRSSRLFISEVKKVKDNAKRSSMLSISEINFITYNAIGVDDFLEYSYKVSSFDKVTEFDGNYVIKFFCEPIINGVNILDKYREEELDKRYENKEARKHTI